MKKVLIVSIMFTSPAWAYHSFHASSRPTWSEPSAITCQTVRAYVGQVGLAVARATALAYGMTPNQERRARRCLAGKA